ncbi:MAG: hypothetical protein H7Y86_20505 [Rhizobacter sp.]|nr:hypothetical protein [Ferruginibacter sp.]
MNKIMLCLCMLFFAVSLYAQKTSLLWSVQRTAALKGYGKVEEIIIDSNAVNALYNENTTFFEIAITDKNNNNQTVLLAEDAIKEVKIKINNKEYLPDAKLPKLYRGTIRGMTAKHEVLLTIAPNYVSFVAYLPSETITIEPDSRKNGAYVMLNSADRPYKKLPFDCGLPDVVTGKKDTQVSSVNINNNRAPEDKCTFVFVDCTNSLFKSKGGTVQNTLNYVYSIWNGVRTAFSNEQLNVFISEINVWTVADPFDTTSTTMVANRSFADFYQNNYWGNMAMLLDWSDLNGAIAGGYGWAKSVEPNTCGNYNATPDPVWNFGSFIYNNLNPSPFGTVVYSNFPVAALAQQVYITTHELGHLFGSWHTHSCNWPGGAIDNCVAVEGPCASTGFIPPSGGTFMSYCSQVSAGINFNNGFGLLPGAVIRQFTENNTCISNCSPCTLNDVVGSLTAFGFLQKEVTNQLIANGTLTTQNGFIKLDAGTKVILQNGFKVLQGSKVQVIIDGCGGIR